MSISRISGGTPAAGGSGVDAGPAATPAEAAVVRGSIPRNPVSGHAVHGGRVGHDVPLKALEHIKGLLDMGGGQDGVISRKDAKALVAELRKQGRGTEALAAENLFTAIDARDSKSGARVTEYDLNKSGKWVQDKLLEAYDKNKNGYSKDEVAKMSPTGRALMELGEVLTFKQKPGRLSKDIAYQGLDHTADLLKKATRGDGSISRADRKKLTDDLYKQGRGTEALAAEMFFKFIDHRDAKAGARVTAADIDKARTYARDHMIDNKDAGYFKNGLSKNEIEKLSTTAKAFLYVGGMVEAGML